MTTKILFLDTPDMNLFKMFTHWFPTSKYTVSCVSSTADLTHQAGEVDVVVIFAYNRDVFTPICAALRQVDPLPKLVFFCDPRDYTHLMNCLEAATVSAVSINYGPLLGGVLWSKVRKALSNK